jgi:hypothetical protein
MRRCVVAILLLLSARPISGQSSDKDSTARHVNSPALLQLLDRASRDNRMPDSLVAFKARVETEIAVLLRRAEGAEQVASIEQIASTLRWTRAGYYDQRVIGHRAQQAGLTLSMLSIAPTGWVQPTLYGSRFRLRRNVSSDTSAVVRRSGARDGSDTMPVVHPLAPDREQWYRFSGGDTTLTVRLQDRSIPIVLVRVRPREDLTVPVVLFDGEVALDAARGTLVRVRGHFVRAGRTSSRTSNLATAVAFVEYEQGERAGAFWLPSRQRIELQAASPIFGESRAVIRIASRFFDMTVNDTTLDAATLAAADSLRQRARRRLTYAPGDSLSRFGDWQLSLGGITDGMHSDDFNDVGPDRWRPTGRPRIDFSPVRASDVVRFNRIEGLFTGAAVKLSLRDVAPGVIVRATGGYAWNEQTARGRLSAERVRGAWTQEVRVGRSLDITNDFRFPNDSGPGLFSAMAGSDQYDYVDRSSATLGVSRRIGRRQVLARTEFGVAQDQYRAATLERGYFGRRRFRENRYVDEGSYFRSAFTLEVNPDVAAEFVKPGIGARVLYERGDGELDFQRAEVRVVSRELFGPIILTSRLDVGSLFGASIPPQQLFELGQQSNFPGYENKRFAGSRAALLRTQLMYLSPFLRQPIRVTRRLLIPGINPGVSVGIQGGWAEAPTPAARAAIDRLRPPTNDLAIYAPLSTPTDGIRATVSAGLRLFSGAMFVGYARAVDVAAPWKLTIGAGF